jgi:hypothetical protein
MLFLVLCKRTAVQYCNFAQFRSKVWSESLFRILDQGKALALNSTIIKAYSRRNLDNSTGYTDADWKTLSHVNSGKTENATEKRHNRKILKKSNNYL